MGFAITWCAVQETNAEDFIQRLNLTPNGETEEIPESLISTAKMKTGWRILWYNRFTCPFLGEKNLAEISTAYDIILCLVEEHTMSSSSELWSGGSRKWHLSHEGIDGPKGLSSKGDLPACCHAIRTKMEEEQENENQGEAEVDYIFEIPLLVAQDLVGFKHDENCDELIDGEFIVLERKVKDEIPATASSKGFFARLFNRK